MKLQIELKEDAVVQISIVPEGKNNTDLLRRIKHLEAEKDVLNDRIIKKALESLKLRVTIDGLMYANVDLEAELSARNLQTAKDKST